MKHDGKNWMVLNISPEPWAVGPVGYARHDGKMSAYVGRNTQLAAYESAVHEEVSEQWGMPMIEGKVGLRFYFWRNRATYTTPQARSHRKHEADATNLQKATEDALQGIIFANDRDVADIHSVLVEQGPDVKGKILIAAWKIDDYEHEALLSNLPIKLQMLISESEQEVQPVSQRYGDDEEIF